MTWPDRAARQLAAAGAERAIPNPGCPRRGILGRTKCVCGSVAETSEYRAEDPVCDFNKITLVASGLKRTHALSCSAGALPFPLFCRTDLHVCRPYRLRTDSSAGCLSVHRLVCHPLIGGPVCRLLICGLACLLAARL